MTKGLQRVNAPHVEKAVDASVVKSSWILFNLRIE